MPGVQVRKIRFADPKMFSTAKQGNLPGDPQGQTFVNWLVQLDDEPNLYIRNGWLEITISIHSKLVL